MSSYLAYGGLTWLKNVDNFDVNSIRKNNLIGYTAWKVSKYGVISGPYFSKFRLNAEICSPNAGKYGQEITLYLDTFWYILEVDLEYPEEFHIIQNDYPLAPEKLGIPYDKLSDYCKKIANEYEIKVGELSKWLEYDFHYSFIKKTLWCLIVIYWHRQSYLWSKIKRCLWRIFYTQTFVWFQ